MVVDESRVFYWFGAYYSGTLFAQAVVMICVQLLLLKVALDNRPSPGIKNGIEHAPFSGVGNEGFCRPYDFWQWKSVKPYVFFFAPKVPWKTENRLTWLTTGYIDTGCPWHISSQRSFVSILLPSLVQKPTSISSDTSV